MTPARASAYLDLVMARWQGPSLTVAAVDRSAYQSFARADAAYGSFAGSARSYGAFATVRR